ncbi:MAG: MarR family transcriptional regulator [Bacteroidetes bacterium]|nr:MAG: MarR family transcriptional regulator [Bacteroidota bacterium]
MQKKVHPHYPVRYGFFIERTSKKIKQKLQRKFNAINAGITVDQWVIINALKKEPGLSQYEIAEKTYKDAPTVTRIIDLLCKKNLVMRVMDENDRRRFNVFLTDDGQEKVIELLPVVLEMQEKGWGELTKEDYDHLLRILDLIFSNLD